MVSINIPSVTSVESQSKVEEGDWEAQTEIPLLLIFSYYDNVSEPDSTIGAKF
jgi:hypothetical protein